MRKHICIVSQESVLAGRYQCGIGEVVDGMAHALRRYYDVTLITAGTRPGGFMSGCITLGAGGDEFTSRAAETVNGLRPDLVHNFADPALIDLLDTECPTVLTFDRWEDDVADKLEQAAKYTHVTTVSRGYAAELLAAHPEAAALDLQGITNGIDSRCYHINSAILADKTAARRSYYTRLRRIDPGLPLVLSMGRLTPHKGIGDMIAAAPALAGKVDLVVYGVGDKALEEQLTALHTQGILTYYPRLAGYFEMMDALRAADWYLMPSVSEACGLQPMKAARLGCVPIVRPVGGLGENFGEHNSVLITGTVQEAVERALALSDAQYSALRKVCVEGTWTWEKRIQPWVELYGLPTAAPEDRPVQAVDTPAPVRRKPPFATKEEISNE